MVKRKPSKAKKAAPKKTGRPSAYTAALAAKICARLAMCESLRTICGEEGMPSQSMVFRWLATNEGFREQYARARESQADYWAEEIVAISDDGLNDTYKDAQGNNRVDNDVIARSKLRVDTRKWLMARQAPKKYGDKVTNEVVGADGGAVIFKTVYESA